MEPLGTSAPWTQVFSLPQLQSWLTGGAKARFSQLPPEPPTDPLAWTVGVFLDPEQPLLTPHLFPQARWLCVSL